MDNIAKQPKLRNFSKKMKTRLKTASEETPKSSRSIDIPSLRKKIISLAIPSIGEFMLWMAVGIVDLAFVGRLGPDATASAGMAWQIIWFFSMIFMGINRGTSAIVARYTGARDRKSVELAAGQSMLLSITISFLTTFIFIFHAEKLFLILRASPEVIESGSSYIRILASSYIFANVIMCGNNILKGAGDTKTPMFVAGFMTILNIFLDYSMMFGKFGFPAHGFLGSAEASVIVTFLGASIVFGGMLMGKFRVRLIPENFINVNTEMIYRIIKIGIPNSVENFFWSGSSAVILSMVAGMGIIPLAVDNILLKAESFSYMPGIGFSIAAGVIAGQALGEKNPIKARTAAWESIKIGMWIMGSMGVCFLLFPRFAIRIFTDNPELLTAGAQTLMVVALIQPVQAVLFVLNGVLNGAGDTKATMFISIIGITFIRVPLAYLFGITMGMGVTGVWGAICLDVAVRSFIVYRRFRGEKWLKAKV